MRNEAAASPSERPEASPDGGRVVQLLVPAPDAAENSEPRRATVIAAAVALARDLINTPSDIKTPGWLAEQAVDVAQRHGLGVRVRDEAELARTDSAASWPSGPGPRTHHG